MPLIDNKEAQDLAGQVLQLSLREIFLKYKFFSFSLSKLNFTVDSDVQNLGVKALDICYDTEFILKSFANSKSIYSYIIHSLFHLMLNHTTKTNVGIENICYYDIACDITVCHVLDNEGLIFSDTAIKLKRQKYYVEIIKHSKIYSAEKVYEYLLTLPLSYVEQMSKVFYVDNHMYWATHDQDQMQGQLPDIEKEVSVMSSNTLLEMDSQSNNELYENIKKAINIAHKTKFDYSKFLHKLLSMNERIRLNEEEFDYAFYSYAMTLYENVAMIEPLETCIDKGLKNVIIAIDTSGSTAGELVNAFIEQTFSLINHYNTQKNSLALRVIQCDDMVRQDMLITTNDELKRYQDNFTIIGGGGTNFNAVFDYVQKNYVDNKVKALLYFTDGCGTYPKRPPNYPVAFVFMDNENNNYNIPSWSIKIVLSEEDLLS